MFSSLRSTSFLLSLFLFKVEALVLADWKAFGCETALEAMGGAICYLGCPGLVER